MAQKRLMSELQTLQKEKWVYIDVDEQNVLKWKIGLMVVNPDSVFNGAYLKVSRFRPFFWPRYNELTPVPRPP
ncbi:hypothetical protein VDGD_20923 [Verticillium dahliae]|nr:hypothetical protein VDGD_20923 [Verticillium dahliae]